MKVRPLFALLKKVTYKDQPLISLADFARMQGTTAQTVYRWQSGIRDIPPDALADLCALLTAAGVKYRVEDVLLTSEEKAEARNTIATLKKMVNDRIKKEKHNGKPTPRKRQDRGTGNPPGTCAGSV